MRKLLFLAMLGLGLTALSAAAHGGSTPSGSFPAPIDPDCYPENAFRALNPGAKSLKQMAASVQAVIDRCQPSWYQQDQSSVFNLLSFAGVKYPKKAPFLRNLSIPLKDGRKVRGLLATKPGAKARDLVIVRCGIFCDVGEGSVTSSVLMSLFEENPVHVLLLNSSSGADWAKDNGIAHIGGFDEGYQNLEVARWISERQGEYKLKIRNLHVMGVSLGGSSSLFSSFYYELAPEFKDLPVKSFLSVCPMVDAEAQFTRVLDSNFIAGALYRSQLDELFGKILPSINPRQRIWMPGGGRASQNQVANALDMSADYYDRNWDRLGFARYLPKDRRIDRQELLELASIPQYVNRFSKPTLVLHASDDMLVPYEHNSKKLLRHQDESFGVLRVDRGNHCAFAMGMGWPLYSQLLGRVFQSQKDLTTRRLPLPDSLAQFLAENPLWKTVLRSHYQWSVEPGNDYATLSIFQYNGHVKGCDRWSPTRGPGGNPYLCQQVREVEIPLTELVGLGAPAILEDPWRAGRLERYLNVHVRLKTRTGALAVGISEDPAYLEVRGSFHPVYGVL